MAPRRRQTERTLNRKGRTDRERGGGEKKRKGSMGNAGNKASSAPISGLRRGNPAIQNSTPCGQSSEHGDTTPLKSAARTKDQAQMKRKRRKKNTNHMEIENGRGRKRRK